MNIQMSHVDVRVLNKLLKIGELSYWLPSHGSLFLLTHRLTDSVLLQLHNEETRRDFAARHIFSLRLYEHQYQFIKLMARLALSLPAMRLSCERTNHRVARSGPVNLTKLTNLLVAQAVSVHVWIFAHSLCRSVTLFGD